MEGLREQKRNVRERERDDNLSKKTDPSIFKHPYQEREE